MPPDEPTDTRLTDRELDVMSILWRAGSGTVAVPIRSNSR